MLSTTTYTAPITGDDSATRGFRDVAVALNPVLTTPLINGNLVTSLTIPASGKLVVAHKLGRPARGFFVTNADANVSQPYAVAADQKTPNGGIVLTFDTGAGATVDVWVF